METTNPAESEKAFDLVIVGAGPSGLNAAKTFLECDPDIKLCLLDGNGSIGGVWARENLYPGLKTNNLYGTIDFIDFPMHEGFGVKPGKHIPGEAYHEYLKAYAEKWDMIRRTKFHTMVTSIERIDAGESSWRLTTRSAKDSQAGAVVHAKKIIVATGVTNVPSKPTIAGQDQFDAVIAHSASLGREGTRILNDPEVKSVAVLGGGKSAYDAVYMFASAGKQVHWIIRKSGRGPAWLFPPFTNLGPIRAQREKLSTTRFISLFSPCIWGFDDGFAWARRFLNYSWLGQQLQSKFWEGLHEGTRLDCGFVEDEKLRVTEPDASPFWYGTASGVAHHESEVRGWVHSGLVNVVRQDVSHLSPKTVHFKDGSSTAADGLITATGFSSVPSIEFKPVSLHAELGIASQSYSTSQNEMWSGLEQTADAVVFNRCPRLLSSKAYNPSPSTLEDTGHQKGEASPTPWRLYRAIAPPGLTIRGDRSIAFIGFFSNVANSIRLDLTCLWAYAYLSNNLAIDPADVYPEAALSSRFHKWRVPYGHGKYFPDITFDQNPFFDLIVKDLGLPYWRKDSLYKEMFESYGQEDYKGLTQEWLKKQRGGM